MKAAPRLQMTILTGNKRHEHSGSMIVAGARRANILECRHPKRCQVPRERRKNDSREAIDG